MYRVFMLTMFIVCFLLVCRVTAIQSTEKDVPSSLSSLSDTNSESEFKITLHEAPSIIQTSSHKKNLLSVTEETRCPLWSTRQRKCPHGEDESCTSWMQIGGWLKCTDVMMLLCLKEGGVPAAEEHLLQSGLQAVHGWSAAAGEGVWLRRGPHPSAQRGLRLPERWQKLNNWYNEEKWINKRFLPSKDRKIFLFSRNVFPKGSMLLWTHFNE